MDGPSHCIAHEILLPSLSWLLKESVRAGGRATSFPGTLCLCPLERDGKKRDPGSEVGGRETCL